MSVMNRNDFSVHQNRCAISEELMKQELKELGLVLIRLCSYMEIGNHPDRQTFWEYLEKICMEKRNGQMLLDQLDTPQGVPDIINSVKNRLDKIKFM